MSKSTTAKSRPKRVPAATAAPIAAAVSRSGATIAAWYAAMALTAWSFGYTIMRGSDLWWHIAGGRWMVENRTLWVPDPYSYTANGQWWLNDAWLSDVLLYLWTQAFGMDSLAIWKWLLIVITWVLLLRLLIRLCGSPLAAWLGATLGLAVAAPFLDVRPQLYSFLSWVIVLSATLGHAQPKRWLPLVMLVWVNLHASFLLGLITLPLVLLPAYVAGPNRRALLLLLGACVVATLINPNGLEVVTRPLRYAFDASSPFRTLGEWLPPFLPGGIQSWLYRYGIAAFVVSVLAVLFSAGGRWRDPRTLAQLGVGALVLAMSLRSRRFIPFFGIGSSIAVSLALAPLANAIERRISHWVAPLAATALALWWLAPYPKSLSAFEFLTARYEFPVDTINFVELNQLSGNVFNYYNWGGYVHLRTHGRLKVFIDGRSETIYSDATFLKYMSVLEQQPGWIERIEASGADFVLWPRREPQVARALLATNNWRSIYQDYASTLLARTATVLPDPLQTPAENSYQLLARGLNAAMQGDAPAAHGYLERALEAQPNLQPACVQLVQSELVMGKIDAARATGDRCLKIYPDPDRARQIDAMIQQVLKSRS